MRRAAIRLTLVTLFAAACSGSAGSQAPHEAVSNSARFPYAFSNFVWWSDASLRAELRKRIPNLTKELAVGSQDERRVRVVLTQLLKQKGVFADVQSEEPSESMMGAPRDPDAPPEQIVFRVLDPPQILVDKLVLENPPQDALEFLNDLAPSMQGRPYREESFWFATQQLTKALKQAGYLSGTVRLEGDSPRSEHQVYVVPLRAVIVSGPKFHVGTVTADGGPLLENRDLSAYFSLKPGDVAKPDAFGRLAASLRSTYWHAGYAEVEIRENPELDVARATATYHLIVIPGAVYRLRALKIEKLEPRQADEVKRLFSLKEGDVYDPLAVNDLYRQLGSADSSLKSFSFSYRPKEDKDSHVVDLTLSFFKKE